MGKEKLHKKKLKLCFIGDASNIHTHRHVNHFVDLGHEVHLVDDHPYHYKSLKLHLVKNGIGIRPLDYFLRILQSILAIRSINPDFLHSFQVTYHGFIGALSGKKPFMLTPWGSDILFVPDYSLYYKIITKFTIFKADAIHCIDVSVINRLEQMYGGKIRKKDLFVLNEGIDTNIFSPANKKPKKYVSVLCLRALRESYGVLLLIEALNILINKKKQNNVRIIMLKTGDKEYQQKIYQKINEYNLNNYIHFFEWINHKTPEYMGMADIYVDTMYRTTRGQGTGKTMLEALSSGLAIAAPDNPSMELYIKDGVNGLIYNGANAVSLANALSKLVKNKNLRAKLGKNAREFALRNLDINKNMAIMEKKYYSLLALK